MNNAAFTGDHGTQLEEIFETIVESEKKSGKNLTAKDLIDIRYDIEQAYDEIVNCFYKENVDSSLVTYAINLMKSTVNNTNDLRNISQIAFAVSESTIGSLYLVNSLKEREQEKLQNFDFIIGKDNNEFKDNIEELTKKIDIGIDQNVLDEISSDENENEYAKLRERAKNGDANAKIALSFIRKAAHLLYTNKTGILNADRKDLAALILVEKISTLGEKVALLSANQIIREFGLEKYDIYSLDENGKPSISPEKIKDVLQKEFNKRGMDKAADKILGLNTERTNMELIERFNADAEERKEDTLLDVHRSAMKDAEFIRFKHTLGKIRKIEFADGMKVENEKKIIVDFIENNQEIAVGALNQLIDFRNKYPEALKKLDYNIYDISDALGSIARKNAYNEHLENKKDTLKLEELVSKKYDKYMEYSTFNEIDKMDDEER